MFKIALIHLSVLTVILSALVPANPTNTAKTCEKNEQVEMYLVTPGTASIQRAPSSSDNATVNGLLKDQWIQPQSAGIFTKNCSEDLAVWLYPTVNSSVGCHITGNYVVDANGKTVAVSVMNGQPWLATNDASPNQLNFTCTPVYTWTDVEFKVPEDRLVTWDGWAPMPKEGQPQAEASRFGNGQKIPFFSKVKNVQQCPKRITVWDAPKDAVAHVSQWFCALDGYAELHDEPLITINNDPTVPPTLSGVAGNTMGVKPEQFLKLHCIQSIKAYNNLYNEPCAAEKARIAESWTTAASKASIQTGV